MKVQVRSGLPHNLQIAGRQERHLVSFVLEIGPLCWLEAADFHTHGTNR